jgi:DNA-binding beta-propeller fold protein YncE
MDSASVHRSAAVMLTAALLSGCGQLGLTPPAHGTVVASGLNGPQGVFVDGQNNVWVVDSGSGGTQVIGELPGENGPTPITLGNTARVVRVNAQGEQTVVTSLPSLGTPFGAAGAARLTALNGAMYVTNGQWTALPGNLPRPDKLGAVLQFDGSTLTVCRPPKEGSTRILTASRP